MTTLYAQPYDTSANGFYFKSEASYGAKSGALRDAYGQPVEEFEIQFIDGDGIDCQLFAALNVHQGSVGAYFEAVDDWRGGTTKSRSSSPWGKQVTVSILETMCRTNSMWSYTPANRSAT